MFLCKIQKRPVTSYGSDEPKADTYQPSDSSYDSPSDPYTATYDNSAGSRYYAAPSYPPQNPHEPSQDGYVVDQPHTSYPTSSSSSYHSPSHPGSYPPEQDSHSSQDSYKPSPPRNPHPPRDAYHASSDTDYYYKPSPSYYAHPTKPTGYAATDAGYPSKDGH